MIKVKMRTLVNRDGHMATVIFDVSKAIPGATYEDAAVWFGRDTYSAEGWLEKNPEYELVEDEPPPSEPIGWLRCLRDDTSDQDRR